MAKRTSAQKEKAANTRRRNVASGKTKPRKKTSSK